MVPVADPTDIAEANSELEVTGSDPEPSEPDLEVAVADPAVAPQSAERPRRGLFGFLRRSRDAAPEATAEAPPIPAEETPPANQVPPPGDAVAAPKTDEDPQNDPESVEVAALSQPVADTPRRGGFFGGLFRSGSGRDRSGGASDGPAPGAPDYEQVGPGVTLPYGQIARLCGVSARKLGREVAKYPERGRGYTLYDSAPGSTSPHSFFLTGFDDGCARQFTAALALFGSPETHEQLRYSPAGETIPTSETDIAYEKVKSRICRVRRGKPCGSRMSQLAKNTVFVSIYDRFGGVARWKNLLLHDGEVVALDIKSK